MSAIPKITADDLNAKALTIVVIGASGDLAKKKTFPALFELEKYNLLPKHAKIVGYSRSELAADKFHALESLNFKGGDDLKQGFLDRSTYVSGQYNKAEDFAKLAKHCESLEKGDANRLFYFAIPPSIFADVSKSIKAAALSATGWNRIVVEKPFGKDSESFQVLSKDLASCFLEKQLYRIDHYLGKEMVQNLLVLRFGNNIFEPLWNRHYISNVQITFKENIGTGGRGGYFDQFGIIRDVLQNHLLQVFSLVAMEPPVSLSADDVRDEKVKVLRSVPPIVRSEVVTGQYLAHPDGSEPGYLEDPTVPDDSVTPTFASLVLHINNSRWSGVPFILKAGKALNERKTEVRIQFKHSPAHLYPSAAPDELVLRVQPNEAVYWKMMTKVPGLSNEIRQSELDLTFKERFEGVHLPDAYERLIFDVLRGDQSQFVRDDELKEAWRVFTPVLHEIEGDKSVKPIAYEFGGRGPKEADELANKFGFQHHTGYEWKGVANK